MKCTSRIHIMLLFSLLCVFNVSTISRTECPMKTIQGVGIGAAIGAAVGGLCYWMCSETDQQVLEKTTQCIQHSRNLFHENIENFRAYFNLTNPNVSANQLSYSEKDEFAPIAQNMFACNKTMYAHLSEVHASLKDLQNSATKLLKRIHTFEDGRYLEHDERMLLRQMRKVYTEIMSFLPYLELYYKHLYEHKSYFALYEFESKLYARYQKEVAYGHQYAQDVVQLTYAIKQCIGTHQLRSEYKYIAYQEMLDRDINELQRLIKRLHYNYPHRYSLATQLEHYLIRVRGIIVADQIYAHEKDMRRQDRQHQQQMQIAQQQIYANQ